MTEADTWALLVQCGHPSGTLKTSKILLDIKHLVNFSVEMPVLQHGQGDQLLGEINLIKRKLASLSSR